MRGVDFQVSGGGVNEDSVVGVRVVRRSGPRVSRSGSSSSAEPLVGVDMRNCIPCIQHKTVAAKYRLSQIFTPMRNGQLLVFLSLSMIPLFATRQKGSRLDS